MKKRWTFLGIIGVITIGIIIWRLIRSPGSDNTVIVYVSEDQVFSEPILKDFETETGIRVRAIYDTEEAKSTGAMNRLIAEQNNPRADVYWANEPIRAEVLKQKEIAESYFSPNARNIPSVFKDPDGYWTGFSARARVFVVNKNVKNIPRTIMAYIDNRRKGKAVIANPLFGTTTAEIAALFTIWGNQRAEVFMTAMKRNQVALSTNNGESADFVAAGRFDFSLVDSDDAINRMRQGKPVVLIYPDQGKNDPGCFIVPNAAVLIKGGPHPQAARKFMDYLLSPETEQKLAFADCAQIPLHPGVSLPPELKPIGETNVMPVNYAEVAGKMLEIQPYLKNWLEY
ncbi:MAG: extracellular solute-binding protein [FCB group bacterium]|nr:extracellular solute-binding protein [FCB group bacterium]